MKHNRNPLATAIHYALGAGMIAGLAMTAAPVAAQDEEAADLDRVQVTGTRIMRADIENTSPVTVLTREEIQTTGLSNVGDLLRSLNQADSLGLSNLTSSTNANDGTQTVSLRGLGSTRTLVLVNGRRWLGLASGQVDTTQIPLAVIERVEVLGDGASAVYGSDAIAGVINIILRTDFEGFEVDFGYAQFSQGDGERTTYGVSYGHRGERGGMFFNINKVNQEEIFAGDRSISEFPVAFVPEAFGSAFGRFGIFSVPGVGLRSLNPDREGPGERTPDDFIPFGNRTRYNFAPTNYLLTPSDRLSVFTSGDYEINDYVRFFSSFSYNKRKSVTQIAEVPLVAGFSGPQWNIPYSGDNVFNPFGVTLPAFGFRMPEPRRSIQDYDAYFTTVGLDGEFTAAGRMFNWDLSYSRGQATRTETGENYVNLLRLAQGVGPSFIDPVSGRPVCGTPDNPTPFLNGRTCVPVNFFNGLTGLTQEMRDFLNQDLVEVVRSGLAEWQFNLAGEIVELPAGPLGFAVGAERRHTTYRDDPDSTIAAGINSNNFREATQGRQLAEEVYAELAIPLLSGVTGAQYLEVSVAARYSDFTNRGFVGNDVVQESFDNTSVKYGILYRPFDDLLLRANYTDTFRAPAVGNLFAGGGEGFPGAIDPCTNASFAANPFASLTPEQQARCLATGVPAGGSAQQTSQLRSLSGGNPLLQPEEGDTKTIGFVWSPSFVDGFDMSVDYWDVKLDGGLAGRGIGSVLQGCIFDGDQDDCNRIDRDPVTGEVLTVRTGQFNLAAIRVKGYDSNINYRFLTENAGNFAFRLNTTYTSSAKVTAGSRGEADNVVSRAIGAFGGPTWRWRANAQINWTMGDFGLTYGMRYLHKLFEPCGSDGLLFDAGIATRQLCSNPNFDNLADGWNKVGGVTYHDLSGSWEAPWDATVRVGVRNLFRKDPPFMLTPFANSFDQAYDIPGRYYWMSYQQRF